MGVNCFSFRDVWFLPIVAILVFVMFPQSSNADIYSFTDENGVVHFTNAPTDSKWKLLIKEKRFDPRSVKYQSLIRKVSKKHSLDDALVKAIIRVESNFNPNAVSKAGAQGLMQLMPGTAQDLKVKDPFNPEENVEGGVKYFRYLLDRFKEDIPLAIAAYHAGENAVRKYNGIPPYDSTQKFVKMVLKHFDKYKK